MLPTLQLLAPDGSRRAAADSAGLSLRPVDSDHPDDGAADLADRLDAYAAELDPERLRTAYRHMVLTRAFDKEATSLQRQGELGLWVPAWGQEAGQVGSAMATPATDFVFPSYREHAVAHVRGLDLAEIIPVFRTTRHGGWDPAAHNFHLYTFVIAAHTLHATGYAMGVAQDHRRGIENPVNAVVCYLGDGATSQGDFNESLVFSASAAAPILFIVQNNHWAISVPTATQSRTPLAQRADGFGIPRLRVDGNDLVASYAATRLALETMAADGGPFLLEFVTYRMGAHTTSDDPTRYRTREEEAKWAAKDPIARVRTLLESEGIADDAFIAELDAEAAAFATRIREFTRANTAGDATELFDDVYASDHPIIKRERAEFAAFLARGEES